jgi:hypothetical protein
VTLGATPSTQLDTVVRVAEHDVDILDQRHGVVEPTLPRSVRGNGQTVNNRPTFGRRGSRDCMRRSPRRNRSPISRHSSGSGAA